MKILISKLPASGWWSSGIPKYQDNPAMREGEKPNHNKLVAEREKLISILKRENQPILEIDFPNKLDQKNPKHDFIFVRDQFISNQRDLVLILRSGERLRRVENVVMGDILNKLNYNIINMPDTPGLRADGGEFYFCAKENILFSGIQRNTLSGINYVVETLKIDELLILDGKGYHLDTFFTPVLNSQNLLCATIVCDEILTNKSKRDLYEFSKRRNLPIFKVPLKDSIGTLENIGSFSVNALPLPGVLISPNHFTNKSIDRDLSELGVKRVITPTSQFELSGGSIHCLTNEL